MPINAASDFLHGTLDVLILKILSWGPRHGYAIARWIRDTTDDELIVEDRALYVSLHRMEQRGWISAEWGTAAMTSASSRWDWASSSPRRLGEEFDIQDHFTA